MRRDLEAAFPGDPAEWAATAELRYGGQSWEVEVALSERPSDNLSLAELDLDLGALRARFEDEHERLYGVRGQPGSPVEIRAVRLAALGVAPDGAMSIETVDARQSAGETRTVYTDGSLVVAPVRTRASVGTEPEPGPLLVDEYDTTVVVPPGWSARRDEATASLILERTG